MFRLLWVLVLACLVALGIPGCGDGKKKRAATEPVTACASDGDCAVGRCDPFVGCVECLFQSDCGPDARCVEQTCHAAKACATNDDCDSGSCIGDAGQCAECTTNAPCDEGEQCSEGACVKFASCETDKDCDGTKRCDADKSECVSCLDAADCGQGAACSQGKCVPHCRSSDDCPSVYHCAADLCELDVCEARRSTCSASGRAALVCSDDGDAFDLSPCGTGRSCKLNDDVAECQKWACKPGQWACSDDHTSAELCSTDGFDVVKRLDCAKEVCAEGACTARVCDPGSKRCDGNALAICTESGAAEDSVHCGSAERCDPKAVECVAMACDPGSAGCLEETVASCADDGSRFDATGDDCAATLDACWQGTCLPVVCEPGFSCVTGDSYECTENRTALTLAESCTFASGQFCNPDSGRCQDFVCEPGQPTCDEDLATSCADDGSRPLDFGIDCTSANKVCWAAECLSPICEPDSYACRGSELVRCVNKGTAFELSKSCGDGTVCDADAGSCRLQKCVPNELACDGSSATTCNAAGLGYSGDSTDCADNGNVCVAGACVPVVCEPNAVYCEDNDVRLCGPNGGSFQLVDACLTSEFCDAARGACVPDACVSGSAVCMGNVLGTCKNDGSGPAPGGIDCGDQVCDQGACRTLVCVPNARSCESGDVVLCNSAGTDFAPYDNCRAREFCSAALAGAAACTADVCPQGLNACSGEQLGTCNSDGSGVATVGVDCSASSKVCDLGGACLATALDSVGNGGAAVPFASSAIHFNLFHLVTARKVVELEAGSEPPSSPLTWIVYRSESEFGSFSRVDQISAPTASSGGYTSSGAITVDLESDAYYLIALAVSGAHDIAVMENAAPAPVSFGVWLGGYSYTAGLPPTIPDVVEVGPGLIADGLALRVHSAPP